MSSSPPQPAASPKTVLILATTHWISTARLALTLAGLGCRVELMAPPGHPALATSAIARHHTYWPMRPLAGLRRALTASKADLLLLADELSFLLVEELAKFAKGSATPEASATLALLHRSFGHIDVLPLARSRMDLLTTANAAGVPIPPTLAVRSKHDLRQVTQNLPGPWMLKADATWGGFGVRKVDDPAKLLSAWREVQTPLGPLRSLKRGWTGKEWGHLRIWLRGSKRDVVAQQFVCGTERTGLVVCSKGKISAAVCFQVEQTCYENGPASIVRVIEDEAMLESMRRTVDALGITGFCGFDFMVDAQSGEPLLLEMNTRPTQLAHLPLGAGRDLCAALVRQVLGCEASADRPSASEGGLVALFPQEILRDPAGSRLNEAFHDVPWSAPGLMQLAVGRRTVPTLLTKDPRWDGNPRAMPALSDAIALSSDPA